MVLSACGPIHMGPHDPREWITVQGQLLAKKWDLIQKIITAKMAGGMSQVSVTYLASMRPLVQTPYC
jgi:hypothetical protein